MSIDVFMFYVVFYVTTTEQKEKLSEVEIQAKKAEAAQRRKMQVEKAARESEVHFKYSLVCYAYSLLT